MTCHHGPYCWCGDAPYATPYDPPNVYTPEQTGGENFGRYANTDDATLRERLDSVQTILNVLSDGGIKPSEAAQVIRALIGG